MNVIGNARRVEQVYQTTEYPYVWIGLLPKPLVWPTLFPVKYLLGMCILSRFGLSVWEVVESYINYITTSGQIFDPMLAILFVLFVGVRPTNFEDLGSLYVSTSLLGWRSC